MRSTSGPVSLPYEPDLKVTFARSGQPDAGVVSVSAACGARTQFSPDRDRAYAPHGSSLLERLGRQNVSGIRCNATPPVRHRERGNADTLLTLGGKPRSIPNSRGVLRRTSWWFTCALKPVTLVLVWFVVPVAALLAPAPGHSMGSGPVAALQVGLIRQGLYEGPVDGLAGPATKQALRGLDRHFGRTNPFDDRRRLRKAFGRWGKHELGARTLRVGYSGWDVAELQFLLAWHGFPSGLFDGAFERTWRGPSSASSARCIDRWTGSPGARRFSRWNRRGCRGVRSHLPGLFVPESLLRSGHVVSASTAASTSALQRTP